LLALSKRGPITYLDLNGLPTWIHGLGAGDTVVMLHGVFGDGRDFEGNLASLSSDFRLVTMDRRGHGRTPDPGGALSHHLMADDTVALIEHLDAGPVRLIGYSDGAVIALLTALRRPELVSRLVLISGVYSSDGWIMQLDHDAVDAMVTQLVTTFLTTDATRTAMPIRRAQE
jgi:pimeloyl-ACP methyl ester carboxylesterase